MRYHIKKSPRVIWAGMAISLFGALMLIFRGGVSRSAFAQGDKPSVLLYDTYPAAGVAEDYVLNGAKWDHQPVTFSIENCPRSLDCDTAKDTVRKAIQLWDDNCGIAYSEVATNGDTRISWSTAPFDGPGGVLGHGYFPNPLIGPQAGDVELDDAETWVTTPPSNHSQVDLLTVLLHELGHSFGLEHSLDPIAVMWSEYSGPRTLAPDDIAACQALYGTPDGAPPPVPAGVTATATTNIRIHSGPATDFPTTGTLPQGTTVPVIGRNSAGDWLYIQYAGLRGWTAGWLFTVTGDLSTVPVVDQDGNGAAPPPGVTPTEPGTSPTQPPAQPSPASITGIATTTSRLRAGPGTGYPTVGSVDSGATVNIVGKNASGMWVFVELAGIRGWAATWLFTISGDLSTVPVLQSQIG